MYRDLFLPGYVREISAPPDRCPFCATVVHNSCDPRNPGRRTFLDTLGTAGVGFLAAASASSSAHAGQTPPSKAKATRIDVHHHIVPPTFLEAHHYQQVPYMRDWTPARAIEAMDRNGIAVGITSVNAPGILLDDAAKARTLATECNEYAAKLSTDHPGRFGAFTSIPALDADASLKEIAYTLDTLKFDGVGLMTSYGDEYLGSPVFTPIFEELNRRKSVVFCHPTIPIVWGVFDPRLTGTLLEMPFDTARTIVMLLFNGVTTRFPNIRFIFAHGGGALPILTQRIDDQIALNKTWRERCPDGLMAALKNIHFDVVGVANAPAFAMLRQLYSINQLLFGTDYPALSVETTSEGFSSLALSPGERSVIERGNAAALFPRWA